MLSTRKLAIGTGAAMLSMTALAGPASAAPDDVAQRGLVNVAVTDTTVQVPVAVAANICNVAVNVLASGLANGAAPCDAAADGVATRGSGGDNDVRQRGLVNIALTDTTVQLPIAVAANVCNVAVNILAAQIRNGAAACDAVADSEATA